MALALEFGEEKQARAFLRGMGRTVSDCGALPAQVAATDPFVLGITPQQVGTDLVVDERREAGLGAGPLVWTEAASRSGRRVTLLAVGTAAGERAPSPAQLATAVRAVR